MWLLPSIIFDQWVLNKKGSFTEYHGERIKLCWWCVYVSSIYVGSIVTGHFLTYECIDVEEKNN